MQDYYLSFNHNKQCAGEGGGYSQAHYKFSKPFCQILVGIYEEQEVFDPDYFFRIAKSIVT